MKSMENYQENYKGTKNINDRSYIHLHFCLAAKGVWLGFRNHFQPPPPLKNNLISVAVYEPIFKKSFLACGTILFKTKMNVGTFIRVHLLLD